MSKLTCTSEPAGTVIQGSFTCATGACSVRCSLRSEPNAQPSHPGRRTSTSTDTCSPGVSRFSGVRRPPSHRDRHAPAVRPEGLDVLDRPAERLHRHARERRRVTRERHPGEATARRRPPERRSRRSSNPCRAGRVSNHAQLTQRHDEPRRTPSMDRRAYSAGTTYLAGIVARARSIVDPSLMALSAQRPS